MLHANYIHIPYPVPAHLIEFLDDIQHVLAGRGEWTGGGLEDGACRPETDGPVGLGGPGPAGRAGQRAATNWVDQVGGADWADQAGGPGGARPEYPHWQQPPTYTFMNGILHAREEIDIVACNVTICRPRPSKN